MTAAALPDVLRPAETAPLLAALAAAHASAERAQTRAVALALDAIGDIALPDATPVTADDQALIRAIAPLYLAAQLEEAELLPAVEALTGLAISGGLQADLGAAASLVQSFWQQRNDRFHATERRALFARLFGSDDAEVVAPFENLMIDLSEALYKLDEESLGGNVAGPHAQTRVLIAARALAANLLEKGGGMTPFAAKEILAAIQSAVQILQHAEVQRAVGGHSLWTAVRAVASRYLHVTRDSAVFVTRGKSGLTILSWLADSLPLLNDRMQITLEHPVIAAATEWLQASLTVRESSSHGGA